MILSLSTSGVNAQTAGQLISDGIRFEREGNVELAEQAYNKAVQLAVTDGEKRRALVRLGMLTQKKGDAQLAAMLAQQVLAIDASDKWAVDAAKGNSLLRLDAKVGAAAQSTSHGPSSTSGLAPDGDKLVGIGFQKADNFKFDIEIVLSTTSVSTIKYKGICEGVLVRRSGSNLVFDERITNGEGPRCASGGIVELTYLKSGSVKYRWTHPKSRRSDWYVEGELTSSANVEAERSRLVTLRDHIGLLNFLKAHPEDREAEKQLLKILRDDGTIDSQLLAFAISKQRMDFEAAKKLAKSSDDEVKLERALVRFVGPAKVFQVARKGDTKSEKPAAAQQAVNLFIMQGGASSQKISIRFEIAPFARAEVTPRLATYKIKLRFKLNLVYDAGGRVLGMQTGDKSNSVVEREVVATLTPAGKWAAAGEVDFGEVMYAYHQNVLFGMGQISAKLKSMDMTHEMELLDEK